jgi:formate hydrogenlyase transcriptional activator
MAPAPGSSPCPTLVNDIACGPTMSYSADPAGTGRTPGTTIPYSLASAGDSAVTLPEALRQALEWLPVGVLLTGDDDTIVIANRWIEQVFGYTSADLAGHSIDVVLPDAARMTAIEVPVGLEADATDRAMRRGGGAFGRRKDGSEVAVDIASTPLRLEGASLIVVSVVEIGGHRRHDEAGRDAHDEQRRFEALVGELGAEFISLRADEVDHAIEDALGRAVRVLDLDRGALFQITESGDFVHTHQWTSPGRPVPPPRVSAQEQFPWHLAQVRAGELVMFATVDDVPDVIDRASFRRLGTRSGVSVPISIAGRVWGALSFAAVSRLRTWTPALINRLRVVAVIFANALARRQADEAVRRALGEIGALRDQLRGENRYLRHELTAMTGAPAIVGHSTAWRRTLGQVRQVAPTDTPVLLVGETGTGKGLLAARLHESSARAGRALVRVNCAAVLTRSIERDLFGSDHPAYDGDGRHVGRLELANHSTVLFDEIADLPLETQAVLARVLRDKQMQRAAGTLAIDVRIVAATATDLPERIARGLFRDDLYYLLNVFIIEVPPLRERPDDVPLLVWRFVDEFGETYHKPVDAIDKPSMAALQRYSWPGNARELRNVVERAVIVGRGRQLRIPLPDGADGGRRSETLGAIEKAHIEAVLQSCAWKLDGDQGAAARLGVTKRVLEAKIRALEIRRLRS